jgi:hypothetical protein
MSSGIGVSFSRTIGATAARTAPIAIGALKTYTKNEMTVSSMTRAPTTPSSGSATTAP